MKKNESGFSLFELMIVIAIFSILSVIAVPNFISWRDNANLRGAAFNLKSDIEMAKGSAIRAGVNVSVVFSGLRYEIFQDTNGSFSKDSGEVVIASRELYNLTVTPNFAGAPSSATGFNSRGTIARVAATTTDKTGTVSLTKGSQTIVIETTKLGFIKIR